MIYQISLLAIFAIFNFIFFLATLNGEFICIFVIYFTLFIFFICMIILTLFIHLTYDLNDIKINKKDD